MKPLLLLLSISYFLFPAPAAAAELFFTPDNILTALGQKTTVVLWLAPAAPAVNAIEGEVRFPADLLRPAAVSDGNSIISFWLERPGLAAGGGGNSIKFSGAIPGGFEGILQPFTDEKQPGGVLAIEFEAVGLGRGEIEIAAGRAFLNDGRGTAAALNTVKLPVAVEPDGAGAGADQPGAAGVEEKTDTVPPEPFYPQIGRHPSMFGNRYFVVFNTQDKESGIAGYELLESRKPLAAGAESRRWRPALSPYILGDQSLKSYLYVRAIDRAGNKRLAVLTPPGLGPGYNWDWNLLILLGVTGIVLFLLWRFWPYRRQ